MTKILLAAILFFVVGSPGYASETISGPVSGAGGNCAGAGTTAPLAASAQTSTLSDMAYACGKGVLEGAITGLLFGIPGAGTVVAGAVAVGVAGATIYGAGSCVMSPLKCAQTVKTAMGNFGTFMTNIVSETRKAFQNISATDLVNLACSIVTGLGVNVLMTFLTGGAGAAGMAAFLASLASKMRFLAPLSELFGKFGVNKLLALPSDLLEKLGEMMRLGKVKEVEDILSSCAI